MLNFSAFLKFLNLLNMTVDMTNAQTASTSTNTVWASLQYTLSMTWEELLHNQLHNGEERAGTFAVLECKIEELAVDIDQWQELLAVS